jgi:outer membrane immunogenic protein
MKTLLGSAVAISALALGLTPAQAADLTNEAVPVIETPAAFNWTGFHFGVHGGVGGGEFDGRFRYETEVGTLGSDASDRAFGAFGGAQIGYSYQFAPNWVAGVEADFAGSGIKVEHTESRLGMDDYRFTYATQIDWFGTLRGRLGYAWDNVLFYGTGGAAYGKVTYSDGGNYDPSREVSGTNWGWAAGAGVEYGITKNITLKTEYLYVDLGSLKTTGFLFEGDSFENDAAFHTLKAGLNYRF